MVSYKEVALQEDPFALDGDLSNDHLVTVQWRESPVQRPEHALLGVMYGAVPIDGDILVTQPEHLLFDGVELPPDHRLPGLLGYEIDQRFPHGPAGVTILAHSPIRGTGR